MELCEHALQADPVTGGHITESGQGWFKVEPCAPVVPLPVKCEHGNYIPEDARATGKSQYCGLCNLDTYTDPILLRTMSRRKPVSHFAPEEKTMDASEFLAQSPNVRISSALEFFS